MHADRIRRLDIRWMKRHNVSMRRSSATMYVRSAGPFAKVVMRNSRMSDPRLIWTAMRGLPCLCLAVTATLLGAASGV